MPTEVQNLKFLVNYKAVNLILIGLIFIGLYIVRLQYKQRSLTFFTPNVSEITVDKPSTVKTFKPVKIEIPAVSINLPVKEAGIKDGLWQVWENAGSHLISSAYPGGNGNVVIYAHNTNNGFGPIRWLTKGALIKLTDEQGAIFTYEIGDIVEVNPDDISYVLPKNVETLTLYTCSGFLDTKRFVVTAKYKGAVLTSASD